MYKRCQSLLSFFNYSYQNYTDRQSFYELDNFKATSSNYFMLISHELLAFGFMIFDLPRALNFKKVEIELKFTLAGSVIYTLQQPTCCSSVCSQIRASTTALDGKTVDQRRALNTAARCLKQLHQASPRSHMISHITWLDKRASIFIMIKCQLLDMNKSVTLPECECSHQ